jgi:hypothetical protein
MFAPGETMYRAALPNSCNSSSDILRRREASKPEQDPFSVGDRLQVRLSAGQIVEATVKAVVTKTGRARLQVSFSNETALIYLWQVVSGFVESTRGNLCRWANIWIELSFQRNSALDMRLPR